MGQVRDLIGAQRAAAAGVVGPAKYSGLEEGAIHNQLPAALEWVEQANSSLRSFELVPFLHQHPRHPSTLGGQRITGAGQGLLFREELLPCSLPLLLRHHWRCLHRDISFWLCHVPIFAYCHIISPFFPETD